MIQIITSRSYGSSKLPMRDIPSVLPRSGRTQTSQALNTHLFLARSLIFSTSKEKGSLLVGGCSSSIQTYCFVMGARSNSLEILQKTQNERELFFTSGSPIKQCMDPLCQQRQVFKY